MTPWSGHFAAMSDEDARNALDDLATQRFGKTWKGEFMRHYGLSPNAMANWMNHGRPKVWALVAMQEWKDGERERLLVEGLGEFKALLEAV